MLVYKQAVEVVRQSETRQNYRRAAEALSQAQIKIDQMSRGLPWFIINSKFENLESLLSEDIKETVANYICTQAEKLASQAEWYQQDTNRRVGNSVKQTFDAVVDLIISLPGGEAAFYQAHVDFLSGMLEAAETFGDWLEVFNQIQTLQVEIEREFGIESETVFDQPSLVNPVVVQDAFRQGEPVCPAAD